MTSETRSETRPEARSDHPALRPVAARPKATPKPQSARSKSKDGLGWKSIVLAAGVGLTLMGNIVLTQQEQAQAAAAVAQETQAAAVMQVVQALEANRAIQTAPVPGSAPRTIVVKVPVSVSGGMAAGGNSAGQPIFASSGGQQQATQSFQAAPVASAPGFVMPAMPAKPVFQAPVTNTRKS